MRAAEAKSHEARLLRNLRGALLPLAGRLAVAMAKAQPEVAAFQPAQLERTLVESTSTIEHLLDERTLEAAQSRRLLDVSERIREATSLTRRLIPKKHV